ncbi:uncharacterized protein SPAPADRAFT_59326 [Spathaspora passalidarum NRRL Y-27907]|uniref:Uncharacterized protein n=1 Tax=Spathaspora passalidarum (strain NRRL Y-27907 / 11-Y1) TaxID=619300 RepID=G3AJN6_SPAPN|nr:uncharacterized protein SPAPADRAFT_59326 [Spathaspora passalidarum NRRL Y-27907]EGW33937.1 hypothetical protein SPAPADRAFT_59326 [Spathaspora passalidarum NRRL Y-27907]
MLVCSFMLFARLLSYSYGQIYNLPQENTNLLSQPPEFIDLGAKLKLPEIPKSPIIYSVKSLDELETKHIEMLSNTNNTFFLKDSNSSLYYDPLIKMWTGLKQEDPNYVPEKQYSDWLPVSSCLDSRMGSGGVILRSIKVAFEATMEFENELQFQTSPIGLELGVQAATGFKVGAQVETTLLFSCSLNEGEIGQMQYRPSYIIAPRMLRTIYKLKGKKLTPYKVKLLKKFKVLLLETPEHRCWVTDDPENIPCKRSIFKSSIV